MRGFVIILMALDHARAFFHEAGLEVAMDDPGTSLGLYLTRWISHFCAPVFVYLAGTSIALMAERMSRKDLAKFVFIRGLWLIFLEVFVHTIIATSSLAGQPEVGGKIYVVMQVLWALGGGMIIMSGAIYFGARVCTVLGAVIICVTVPLHHMLQIDVYLAGDDPFWITLFTIGSYTVGPAIFASLYPVIPWTGVMLLGYGTAGIFKKEPAERDSILVKTGLILIVLFFFIRSITDIGDQDHWQTSDAGLMMTIFDYFNVSKYPPSLLFFLATLGPMAIMCAFVARIQGKVKEVVVLFGRVPLSFYILHMALLNVMSMIFGVYQGFELREFYGSFRFYPEEYGTGLPGVYLVFVIVTVMLYPVCRWIDKLKSDKSNWWASYL